MSSADKIMTLSERGVVCVSGEDAAKLLGGLITNDMALLDRQGAIYAALLSPQGKILFDFFVVKSLDALLIDIARDKIAEFIKRLTLYKLRAKVAIEDKSAALRVAVHWSAETYSPATEDIAVYQDPRLADLGSRIITTRQTQTIAASQASYDAHRIGLGVPEGGRDWDFGDTFPHEALLDQLCGVSFTKGCYVGQEIVSRMEHRGTARKRVVKVVSEAALPGDRPEVLAGGVEIGRLGSVDGNVGLALLRLDRVAEAEAKGVPLMAGGTAVRVELPAFASFKLGSAAAG